MASTSALLKFVRRAKRAVYVGKVIKAAGTLPCGFFSLTQALPNASRIHSTGAALLESSTASKRQRGVCPAAAR